MTQNRRFILKKRPSGVPVQDDFELISEPLPFLAQGSILVRNHFVSLDPAIRGWLDDAPSYLPPVALGDAVRATAVGRVVKSKSPNFEEGQWVLGLNAIEEYSVVEEGGFTAPIDTSIVPSPTIYLSILGAIGMTAYFGLLDAGQPRPGETVLVSGAAGAVGSAVGQIAKNMGCRTIGIAGGPEKCRRLIETYGYDSAIDYRGKDVAALDVAIKNAAPQGVDIIFENVGGDILDAGILSLNEHARVVLCGLISEYNTEHKGAKNLWQLIVKQASIKGFLIRDYAPRFAEGGAEMAKWIADGSLVFDEHIESGIENTFDAFMMLFSGQNTGKLILDIGSNH
jgi:NADPH-dependent curcumin reductase CurA